MDKALVKTSLKEALKNFNDIRNSPRSLSQNLEFTEHREQVKASKSLIEVLSQQEVFSKHPSLMARYGMGSSRFGPNEGASFLFRQAKTLGTEQAVDLLAEILETKEANLFYISAIRGVNCPNEIKLTERFSIMPFEMLPPSQTKESFRTVAPDQARRLDPLSFLNPLAHNARSFQRLFLVTRVIVKPVFFDASEDTNITASPPPQKTYSEIYESFEEIRLCLTALSLGSPLEELNWNQYENEKLNDATGASNARGYRHIEIIPTSLRESKPLQKEDTILIIQKFWNLPEKLKERTKIALSRLNQGMRRLFVGEMALELSIALECLLLDNTPGDNTFKVSLRAGIAFSNILDERIACRKNIKKLYALRSRLVHYGKTDESEENKKTVEEAIRHTSKIILNIIQHEKEPDWLELELSGKPLNSE